MKVLVPKLFLLLALLVCSGCASAPAWFRYELFFGLSSDGGRTVIAEQQWRKFQDDAIVSRFPDGFTIYAAEGHWRSNGEHRAEPARILMVVAPATAGVEDSLNAIARQYARTFRQDAVLKITSPVTVDYYRAAPPPSR